MRTGFGMAVVGALALLGMFIPELTKPEEGRSIHREAAASGWEHTDFECADLGSYEELRWVKGSAELYAADVEIVDTNIEGMGDRSVAPQENCLSDVDPSFVLKIEPFQFLVQLTVARIGDQPVQVWCWETDESEATLYEPLDPIGPDDVYTFGVTRMAGCRFVATALGELWFWVQ